MDGSIYHIRAVEGRGLALRTGRGRWARRSVPLALAVAIAVLLTNEARAIIVGSQPGIVPATTVNPVDYPGWSLGDPGWYNVAVDRNFVYLGDGWVLSARHAGYNVASGIQFQTILPDGSLGPVERFDRIPGSYYFDYGYGSSNARQYAVSNPTSIQLETGGAMSLAASNGTYFTDLQLFRINGDPGLPPLALPNQPLPHGFTDDTAPEVVAIGRGRGRQFTERTWYISVDPNDEANWTWATDEPSSYDQIKQGYWQDNLVLQRFGTNRLANPRPYAAASGQDDALFKGVVSDTTAVMDLETPDGVTRAVIAMMTVYDRHDAAGATGLEFQAVGGNSGTAIFYRRNGDWELAGIINAVQLFPKQPAAGVYGNATLISDLYYYNQDYENSIRRIIDSHPNYSHMGDINLDGFVSDDDLLAWSQNWGFDSGLGYGTVESWKRGDLNRDGRVDAADYVLLRKALQPPSAGAVSAMLAAVPEPSAAVLIGMGAAAWLAAGARRARRRR